MKTFKYSITVLAGILIIVGNASALTVTSPNGGETWIIGSTHTITWDYSGPDSRLKLELIKEGVRVGTIAENIQAGQKRFLWKVGNYIGGRAFGGDGYKIRATMMNSTDSDDTSKSLSQQTRSGHVVISRASKLWKQLACRRSIMTTELARSLS